MYYKDLKIEFIENIGVEMMRDIGIDVKNPVGEWDGDENCPFNGSLRVRGQLFEGIVSSIGMAKSIIVELQKVRYMPKYERYEKRTVEFQHIFQVVLVIYQWVIELRLWNVGPYQKQFHSVS